MDRWLRVVEWNWPTLAYMRCVADSLVKLVVMGPSGKPIAKSKTSTRRGQPNPLFKEIFMFQVPVLQLADVSLLVSVHSVHRTLKKKAMFGWFTIGESQFSRTLLIF